MSPSTPATYYRVSSRQPDMEPIEPSGVPLLLTVPEACAALRISRWTFYRLLQRRTLKTIRIGNRRLIPAASVTELISLLTEQQRDD